MESHHDWAGMSPPSDFRYPPISLQARGDFAVFTRPEFSSERVSYPVMTPTAAVGLLSAVLWKPQVRWIVEKIEVLAPVRWANLRRNEAGTAITRDSLKLGHLDVDRVVQQRMTTMLRDVHYRIHAHIWVHPEAKEQDSAKWRDQLHRRVARGQSFRTPFLGMREFHADVAPVDATPAISWTEDIGIMLHSIRYDSKGRETYDWFDARVEHGAMRIPREGLLARHAQGVQR